MLELLQILQTGADGRQSGGWGEGGGGGRGAKERVLPGGVIVWREEERLTHVLSLENDVASCRRGTANRRGLDADRKGN